MTGWKSRYLHVITEEIIGSGKRIDLSLEVALLVVPARSPAQAAADVEVLAEDMAHHVGRRDALSGAFIVCTSGRVNVMIPRIPARGGGMHPAAELERLFMNDTNRYGDLLFLNQILRPASVADSIFAGLE